MKELIQAVADSTRSAINKVSRSIRQSKPDPDIVNSLSRLIDSFTRLYEQTKTEDSGNYYEEMEKDCLAEIEADKKLKKRKR